MTARIDSMYDVIAEIEEKIEDARYRKQAIEEKSLNFEILEFIKKALQNIRNFRENAGISQLDLALEIGIKSVAFYSNCENLRYGKHFNLEHIYKIAKALNVNITALKKQ